MSEQVQAVVDVTTLPPCMRDARQLIMTIDQSMRIVSHVAIRDDGDSTLAFLESESVFGDLITDDALTAAIHAQVASLSAGRQATSLLRTPQGRLIRLSLLPRFQAGGRRRGFFVSAEDITDAEGRRRENRALRERMAEILRRAADVIVVADARGRIEETNDAISDLLGWKPAELIGQPLEILMDEPYRSAHRDYLTRYLETGASGILNVGPRLLPARHRDGSVVAIELSVADAMVAGERKFIGVCRGIGERLRQRQALEDSNRALQDKVAELEALQADLEAHRRNERDLLAATEKARREAEDMSRAKSRFLAAVSHELRTPLNGVLAVADVLAHRSLDREAAEMVQIIRGSGHSLLQLLNETLDLSRIESGVMTIRAEPFDLADLGRSAIAMWRAAAQAKNLELCLEMNGPARGLVGDVERLRQVLSNLISNAIKFTTQGRVRLIIDSEPAGEGFVSVNITVLDTGPGIAPEIRDRLFDPFVAAAPASTPNPSGAGLGLAISRELIGLMGGAIRAEDGPGGGTAMIVQIEAPACATPTSEAASTPQVPAPHPMPADEERIRVLAAEDHPVNRQVLGLLLDQIGAAYEMVEDGAAAVTAAAAGAFDVILMDIRMPRMDGLAAARAIRAAGSRTPIIAVTAEAAAEQETRILAAGMNAVLPKPVTLSGLVRALESLSAERSVA